MPWIERVRDLQPLDAALDVANPLLKRLVSAINPVSGIDGAVTIPITRYGTINNQPTPFGVGAKSSSIAASNALCSTISSIGAADSTIILVVYNHALIADANNHFAGGSYRSGSLTTAIQLSNGAGTHYWQALTGNGSINTLSSNEVLPVGLSVLAHTQRGGLISIYRNGVLKNSTSAANGNSNDTFCICDIDGPALSNSTDRAILLGLKIAGALSASELAAIGSNPWQLFEKERIWVPVAAGGSSSTITQADGTSTAGTLGGSATAATTPAQADGTSTAASIAASATAAAGVTQADGASTAATLVGVASTGSTITQADGSTVASVLAGSATSSAAATQADGVSTVGTLAGSATAASVLSSADGSSSTSTAAGSATSAAALTQADGLSTVSTLTGAGTGIAAFTQADGVSTTGTLTGTGLAAGSSTITPAAGSTTAGAIAGSSTAIAAITQADGTTTAGTLSSSSVSPAVMTAGAGTSTTSTLAGSSIFAAAMTQASGATTASAFAASAVAACVAIAAAGASSAQALAGIPPNTSNLAGIIYEVPEDVRSSIVLADARGFTVLED